MRCETRRGRNVSAFSRTHNAASSDRRADASARRMFAQASRTYVPPRILDCSSHRNRRGLPKRARERCARIELERAWEILREIAGSLEPGFEPDAAGGPFATLRPGNAILGRSPAMVRVRTSIDQLSRRSRAPVLISGEVGTGRRHCALALHAATYPDGPFLELEGATLVDAVEQRVAALGVRASAEAIVGLTLYVHELTEAPPAVRALLAKLLKRQIRYRMSKFEVAPAPERSGLNER